MRDFEFFVDKLSELGRIEITCYSLNQYWDLHVQTDFNPIREHIELRDRLIAMTKMNPQLPAVIRDENNVLFAAILWEDAPVYNPETDIERPATKEERQDPNRWTWFFIGPSALHSMDIVELHRYYRTYTDKPLEEKHPPVLSFARFLSMVQVAAMILGKRTDEEEIIRCNHLDAEISVDLAADQIRFSLWQEDEEAAHHTFDEEETMLNYVRAGCADEALHQSMLLDQQIGQMSLDQMLQWRKVVTVAVALVSRAAIDGGLSPAEAYRVSDYYLQKSDTCTDVPALISCRNQAVKDFCKRVAKHKAQKKHSAYVLQCCEYIRQHYREKIFLDEIAAELHISSSYLSRVFSKEMGVRLQDYIVKVRVERAENLLKFTNDSIAKIGDYVGFPSQSYFGNTFRKLTGMTPKQYRDKYQNKWST